MPDLSLITSLTGKNVPSLLGAGSICVAVTASSVETLLRRSAALMREFPFQELRFDHLPDPTAALPFVRTHRAAFPAAPLLATCRRVASGGHFAGGVQAEFNILLAAARAGCALVDLSVESAELLPRNAVQQLQAAGAAVVLSWHDFERTGDLKAVLERMRPYAPDVYKIVPTAQRLLDTLRLFELLQTNVAPARIVGICMGEEGVLSRVLGPRAGSAFTFAAAGAEEATAPGQLDARTLRDFYRIDSIGATTQVFGVAGDPVASSMSPAMLNAAFAHTGTNAVYVPLRTHDAEELFELARRLPLAGFSVTMPLKQAVLPFLSHIDPLARKIGAVNTVRREPDGSFSGFNTDAAGIVGPLEARLSLRGARVLVLGAGGAARAAVFGCVDRGAEVTILNRTFDTAAALAGEAKATAIRREDLRALPPFDVVINATPAGMRGNSTPLPLSLQELRTGLVFDMVYNPQETPLLRAARESGIAIIPGVEMFVRQGAKQFELWTGKEAPVAEMQRVVLDRLATTSPER